MSMSCEFRLTFLCPVCDAAPPRDNARAIVADLFGVGRSRDVCLAGLCPKCLARCSAPAEETWDRFVEWNRAYNAPSGGARHDREGLGYAVALPFDLS